MFLFNARLFAGGALGLAANGRRPLQRGATCAQRTVTMSTLHSTILNYTAPFLPIRCQAVPLDMGNLVVNLHMIIVLGLLIICKQRNESNNVRGNAE